MSSDSSRGSKKPLGTAFKQQQLPAWQPILTPFPVIVSFIAIGIAFIPVGIALLFASNAVVEVSSRYDDICPLSTNTSTPCVITLNVTDKMTAPVYMYYKLENFYQNHRRYVKSRNDPQLRGEVIEKWSALQDCDPRRSEGEVEDVNKYYLPCGLIAWSMFNDSFVLADVNTTIIPLRKKGIAWSSDVDTKFKNPPADAKGIRVIQDFEDEDFIVWMRTAGLPNFKKLYRIIDQDIEPGVYYVTIDNNFPVSSFNGKKFVVLSTTTWIGGKNPFLGWAYIVIGIICFLLGVAFAIKHTISPRKLGDVKYLDWNK